MRRKTECMRSRNVTLRSVCDHGTRSDLHCQQCVAEFVATDGLGVTGVRRVFMDDVKRIAELESLLRRIDDVTHWETTPLGRGFQDEIEAALGINKK